MFSLTNSPSTRPERMSVPVIDTSSYSEAQLNALPQEIARRNRVARLAAAMRALHEQTMRNMDAELLEEDVENNNNNNNSSHDDLAFETNLNNNNRNNSSSSSPSGLKFHAVGWNPNQFTSESRQRRRAELFISPDKQAYYSHGGPQPNQYSQSRSRVIPNNNSRNYDLQQPELSPSPSQLRNSSWSPTTTSPSAASRQRQKLQNALQKQDFARKINNVNSNKTQEQMNSLTVNNNNNNDKDHLQQQQETPDQLNGGETEAEKFRTASVQLRNINLKLKVMFERRYRARLDDNFDAEDIAEEKRRKHEVDEILRKESEFTKRKLKRKEKKLRLKQQLLDGENANVSDPNDRKKDLTIDQISSDDGDDDAIQQELDAEQDFDENDEQNPQEEGEENGDNPQKRKSGGKTKFGGGNAKLSMLLEQKERELGEATRQWRQSTLDAELLTGELLRAQATISRYKNFMEDMTSENERLRAEVESMRRELLTQKVRNQNDGLGRYSSFRSGGGLDHVASFKSVNSIEEYVSGLENQRFSSSPSAAHHTKKNSKKSNQTNNINNISLSQTVDDGLSGSTQSRGSVSPQAKNHNVNIIEGKNENRLQPVSLSPGPIPFVNGDDEEIPSIKSNSASPKQVSFRIATHDKEQEEAIILNPTETTSRGNNNNSGKKEATKEFVLDS